MKIVYLVFSPNTAYVQVTKKAPKGVKVFPDKGIWKWPGHTPPNGTPTTLEIGKDRYIGDCRYGIIGVYDVDNISHLNQMTWDAVESQRDYSDAD